MALKITLLALALTGATASAQVQAVEQAGTQLDKTLSAGDLAACGLSFPLPTTPTGPSVTKRFSFPVSAPIDMTIWRKPCDHDNAIVLITVKPVREAAAYERGAYFCGVSLDVAQHSRTSMGTFVRVNEQWGGELCGDVREPITGWFDPYMPEMRLIDGREFGHEDPFTVSSPYFEGTLEIPAYDYDAYRGVPSPSPGTTPAVSLDDDFSGSWYHAGEAVKNQGWFLEFSDDSHTPRHALAAWFTGNANGTALMWYTAHGSYQGNVATLKVYQTDNVTFGGNTGSTREVGTLKFTFNSCSTGTAEWQFQDGRTGTLPITRMIPEPDDCD